MVFEKAEKVRGIALQIEYTCKSDVEQHTHELKNKICTKFIMLKWTQKYFAWE